MATNKNKHIGSSLDDFLEDEDLLADVQAEAIKRVIAWQIQQYIDAHNESKTSFTKKLHTSRAQLDRLLDPENTSVNLRTLSHAAEVMGKKLEIRFV